MRVFYRKPTSILVVAAIVVLIFLFCMLLITLTQLTSLKQKSDRLKELAKLAEQDEEAKQELIAYRETDKYVIDWAISMGLIPEDTINFIKGLEK